ncbi:MAG: dephospho-CoA kinase [Planctomycetota bacterium]
MASRPVIIGLTGGIGSGKTYIARLFRNLGACVVDADRIGHQAIGRPDVRKTLVKWYGRDILNKAGRIDRGKVSGIVFASDRQVRRLNKLTHPYIRKEMFKQVRRLRRVAVVVIDAPLLLESNLDKFCDYTVFIDTPHKLRLKRILVSRDWDAAEIKRREKYQMPLSSKKSKADFVVDNRSPSSARTNAGRIFRIINKVL